MFHQTYPLPTELFPDGDLTVYMQNTPQNLLVKSRPLVLILCYPVITSGEHRNIGSFEALLGENPDPDLWNAMSLEHKVTEHTPKTFIWHTFDDNCVPPQNSLLFVSALKQAEVPCEFHLYPHGMHGLSLATEQTAMENGLCLQPECAGWIDLVKTWIKTL